MAAEVSKPDFSFQWASGGAIVAPSTPKIQTGWVAEVPPFQWENWSQNRQDNAILHLFQKGVSEWDAASNYYFTTSGVRSYVQGSNGVIYVAVQDSVGQDPTTDTTNIYWAVAFASPADATVGGIAGTASNLRGSSTGLSALVTVTADSVCVKNTTNQQRVLNTVSIAPSIAASGVNGLDTGTSAANTWYYVWVIWNPTTSTTAGLISLSKTTPTMPSGYTYKARVSEFLTDSTGSKFPFKFIQGGKIFGWVLGGNRTNTPVIASGALGNIVGSPAGWVSASILGACPPSAIAISVFLGSSVGTDGVAIAAPNALYGGVAGNPSTPLIITGGNTRPNSQYARFVLEGVTTIQYASNVAQATLNCSGWESDL